MPNRVVITGIGAINSIGIGAHQFCRTNLLNGVAGAGPVQPQA